MSLKEQVIEYVKSYYGRHGSVPSIRNICSECHVYPAGLYAVFPERLKEICNLAGVPLPRGRIRRTQNARKKRIKTRSKIVKPEKGILLLKTEGDGEERPGPAKSSPLMDNELKQSYERTQRERQFREERALQIAKKVNLLASDPIPEIRNPVLDAFGKILPQVLRRCYSVSHGLTELLDADVKLSAAEKMKQEAELTEKRARKLAEDQKQAAEALESQLEDARRRQVETEAEKELWKKNSNLLERQVNLLLQSIRDCDSCLSKYTFAVLKDEKLSSYALQNPMVKQLIKEIT
jgi:hypothetical protein